MSLVKSGQIANCCHPNALMTLKEYLEDYASPDTREKGLKVIEKELQKVEREKTREICARRRGFYRDCDKSNPNPYCNAHTGSNTYTGCDSNTGAADLSDSKRRQDHTEKCYILCKQ